jgi:hypothetical protein
MEEGAFELIWYLCSSALLSSSFSFIQRVLFRQEEPRPSIRTSQTLPESHRSPTSPRGRALPRKWGKLGAKPAARREKERVSPPTNHPCPRSGPSSPSGGSGAAAPESAFSLSETKPADELIGPLLPAKPSVLSIHLRPYRAMISSFSETTPANEFIQHAATNKRIAPNLYIVAAPGRAGISGRLRRPVSCLRQPKHEPQNRPRNQ